MVVEIAKLIKREESVIAIVGSCRIKPIGLYIFGQLMSGLIEGSFSFKVLHWISSTGSFVNGVAKNSVEIGKIIVKVIEKIIRVTGTVSIRAIKIFFKRDSIVRINTILP